MHPAGIAYALLAYGAWGIFPIYWKALRRIDPAEVLAHRILWTLVFCALILTALGRWAEVRDALGRRRERWALLVSAGLISANWLIFIWAVAHERILETSLGYYLNPLLSVVLGTFVLGERLRRAQLAAVGLAGIGVAGLVLDHGGLPWVSLSLAASFGLYGLAHKLTRSRPIPRLAIETGALAPLAAGYLAFAVSPSGGALLAVPGPTRWLLVGAGPITALPLLWFASAARRLSLSTLGLFQYLSPTLALLIAVFLYGERFTRAHAFAFACIWSALAVFTAESLLRERRRPAPRFAEPMRAAAGAAPEPPGKRLLDLE